MEEGGSDGPNPRSLLVLDVRDAKLSRRPYPGRQNIPRGQLELRVNDMLTDPTRRIVIYGEYGKISSLATATLRDLGYTGAAALHGGYDAWKKAGYPDERPASAEPSE